jgi:hypothetical protein
MDREAYAAKHAAVCNRTRRKVLNPKPEGEHKSKGRWLTKAGGKMQCGRRLYDLLIENNIDVNTVLHYGEFVEIMKERERGSV